MYLLFNGELIENVNVCQRTLSRLCDPLVRGSFHVLRKQWGVRVIWDNIEFSKSGVENLFIRIHVRMGHEKICEVEQLGKKV